MKEELFENVCEVEEAPLSLEREEDEVSGSAEQEKSRNAVKDKNKPKFFLSTAISPFLTSSQTNSKKKETHRQEKAKEEAAQEFKGNEMTANEVTLHRATLTA